jgi:hypothetical protein
MRKMLNEQRFPTKINVCICVVEPLSNVLDTYYLII